MPAAGMHAASNGWDFGTSRWLLCTTLHQLIIMWKSMESQKLAVRPEGANHQWRKNPPRELSIDLVADERLVRATARAGAS
jgi:hypothetical protein